GASLRRFKAPARLPRSAPHLPYTTLFRSRGPVRARGSRPRPALGRRAVAAMKRAPRAVLDALFALATLGPVLAGTPYRASQRGGSEDHTAELQSHLNLVCRLLPANKRQSP